jgi:RHS repeat-associated protein
VDELGIIHMNGRIYDPELGRFLSADPNIQAPLNSQSHNRYSYVLNNPLKYTDPSGYSWWSKTWKKVKRFYKKHWRTIVAIGAAFVTGGLALAALGYGFGAAGFTLAVAAGSAGIPALMAAGAVGGFVGGAIMTGTLKGAVRGAIFGGISAGISRGISLQGFDPVVADVLHGVAQGTLSEAFGGDFKSGFIGAFVGHSVGAKLRQLMPDTIVGRTIAASVTGGIASKLGGGKFANGAVSAAFSHLFNNEMSKQRHTTSLGDDPKKDPVIGLVVSEGAKERYMQCGGEKNSCGVTWSVSGVLTAEEAQMINNQNGVAATHVSTVAGVASGILTARARAPLSVSLLAGATTNEVVGNWTSNSIVPVVEGDVIVNFLVQKGVGEGARLYSFDSVIVRQRRH